MMPAARDLCHQTIDHEKPRLSGAFPLYPYRLRCSETVAEARLDRLRPIVSVGRFPTPNHGP